MREEELRFLGEGVDRYLEACSTIAHFRKLAGDILCGALEGHGGWGRFRLSAVKPTCSRAENPAQYIAGNAIGTLDGQDVTVEVGFWWGEPKAPAPAIAYAAFCAGPAALQQFPYVPSNASFLNFPTPRTHVSRPITAASDLAAETRAVLAELLRSAGVTTARVD